MPLLLYNASLNTLSPCSCLSCSSTCSSQELAIVVLILADLALVVLVLADLALVVLVLTDLALVVLVLADLALVVLVLF